jgi:2-polyprenyl-3-methyl-5-hydroxy-6-metoxy-1,4-benzoquinol methylase
MVLAAAPPKYWSTPEDSPTLRAELSLIPDGSRVLEIGTAAGHVTRALAGKGCSVVGLEIDSEQARLASPFCRRMIVGNIEHLDMDREVAEQFDIVLCGDVLEHLQDPAAALEKLKRLLGPGGYLVVSLPNIAHGSVRLSLVEGRFTYSRYGLLDATHLRFFTLPTIVDLFNGVGLEVQNMRRTRIGLFESEIPLTPGTIEASSVVRIITDPEGTTYQFVFRAVPSNRKNALAELVDATFNPEDERKRFAADALIRSWKAFHDTPPRLEEARDWARLALRATPSPKAARYWAASFLPRAFSRVLALRGR